MTESSYRIQANNVSHAQSGSNVITSIGDGRYMDDARPVASRREVIFGSAGLATALAVRSKGAAAQVAPSSGTMTMPRADGPTVGILIDQGATVIDFAGVWDVFAAAEFQPMVISPTKQTIVTISGMKITPDFGLEEALFPQILVIPAQGGGQNPKKLEWIRRAHRSSQATLSVCTGSFLLARAGLLDGQRATTHHDAYDLFAKTFPRVKVVRGQPFVLSGKIGTASAGLFGVDLALNTVARLSNLRNARQAAAYMGHQGSSWEHVS